MPRVQVGMSDLRAFSDSCRRAGPGLRTAVTRRLLTAGNLIADDARARNVSTQTTISVESAGDVAVAVVARGPRITGLLEDGNKGGGGGGTFRHPVYGNMNVWVRQPMHPFLRPAVESKGPAAMASIAEAIDDAYRIAAEF